MMIVNKTMLICGLTEANTGLVWKTLSPEARLSQMLIALSKSHKLFFGGQKIIDDCKWSGEGAALRRTERVEVSLSKGQASH